MPTLIALDVPPLAKAQGRTNGIRIPNYTSAEGAIALAERIRAAWERAGQPVPAVEIVELRGGGLGALGGSGKSIMRAPRASAPGGVPAGYAGRVRVL